MRIIAHLIVSLVVTLVAGCTITPFDGSGNPVGSVYVTATDSSGAAVTGGSIFIDNQQRPERTPAYIHGLDVGTHTLIVKKLGFWNDTTGISIIAADTIERRLTLKIAPAGAKGALRFVSDPPGARLLLDGFTFNSAGSAVRSPSIIPLQWGTYSVSAYLDGYRTISPLLPQIELAAGDTITLNFTLSTAITGADSGKIPFPFTLATDTGDTLTLTDLTGYVVLLNFFYADCKPCMEEFPGIEAVYKARYDDGFRVVAVDPMYLDNLKDVRTVRRNQNVTFNLLLDWDHSVNLKYGLRAYPKNIIIDRTGAIRRVALGLEQEELENFINPLL